MVRFKVEWRLLIVKWAVRLGFGAVALFAFVLFQSAPAMAAPGYAVIDGIAYSWNPANPAAGITVVGTEGSPVKVSIPATVFTPSGSGSVTAIADGAFEGTGLRRAVIGENVTAIGSRAFADNPNLTSITFEGNAPSSFVSGGDGSSFGDSTGLIIYRFGDSVGFDESAWSGYDIENVTIDFEPNGGGGEATSVIVPSAAAWLPPAPTVTRDGYSLAFWSTSPDGSGTDYRTGRGTYPESIALYAQWVPVQYGSGDPFTYTFRSDRWEIASKTNWASLLPGDGAEGYAAWGTFPRWELAIPDSYMDIDGTIHPVQAVANNAFSYAPLATLRIPDSVLAIGDGAFNDAGLIDLKIPDSVKTIGASAFSENRLVDLDLGQGATKIASYAFAWNALSEVSIPASVNEVGSEAFSQNPLIWVEFKGNAPTQFSSLDPNGSLGHDSHLIILYQRDAAGFTSPLWNGYSSTPSDSGSGLPSLVQRGDALYRYDGTTATLVSYVGPSAVTFVIPSYIFVGGSNHQVTSVGDYAFLHAGLFSITIPETVTRIGDFAFADNLLTQIQLPLGLTTIGRASFEYNWITKLVIPDSVVGLGDWAFFDNALNSVTLGHGLHIIESLAFAYNQLTSLQIPANITSIDQEAFEGNPLVGRLTIPASVRSIGGGAFADADFSAVLFLGDAPTILPTGIPEDHPFGTVSNSPQVFYIAGARGFSAKWSGYVTAVLPSVLPEFQSYISTVGVSTVGYWRDEAAYFQDTGGMWVQHFDNGWMTYKPGIGVHFIPNGPILNDWLANVPVYGSPVTDSFDVSPTASWADPSVGSARLQYFEGAGLVDSEAHGLTRIPAGQVLTKYRQVGAAKIGWPLPGDPEGNAVPGTSDTVYAIHFDLQTVATGPGGPWVMDNALYAEWKAEHFGHGGYPSIGYPTADSFQVKAADAPSAGAGVMEFFQAGALAAPVDGTGAATRTPAFVPAGGVLTYLRSNGVAKTGWPVAAPDCASLPGGCFEQFDLGRVTVSNGKIGFVPAVLVPTWAGTAATTFIGYPTGDAFTIEHVGGDSGTLQWFAAGAVVHSDDLGSWFVPAGAVLTTLRSQGIAKTGWPTAAALCPEGDSGCYQVFSLSTVMVSTAGTYLVPAAIFTAWQTGGGSGVYGYPIGPASITGGVTSQRFANGTVTTD